MSDRPDKYKEIKTLINAGYAMYIGIGLLVLAMGALIRMVMAWMSDTGIKPNGIHMLTGFVIITSLLGALLVKIGIEAKKTGK